MEKLRIEVVENATKTVNIMPETPFEKVVADCMTDYLEMRNAEEQGILLRLPLAIGTTVYKFEPFNNKPTRYIETIITRYDVYGDSVWFCFANGLGRNILDFGKTVFLTKEEAEQALKQMGE